MESYCSNQNIIDRKGLQRIAELTGDPQGETVNQARVTLVKEEFATRMNNAIRKSYPTLPFDETNAYLNGLNIEGAYLILERDKENGWSDDQRADWKLIMKDLEDIANGLMDLRTETDDEINEQAEGSFSTNGRLFNRNSLSGPEDYHA